MDDSQSQHLQELRRNYTRRLHVLELQVASFGLYAPPHMLIEIEDIRKQIAAIDTLLTENTQPVKGFRSDNRSRSSKEHG